MSQINEVILIEHANRKFWYLNNQRHRVDGPAIEWANGTKEWWFNGKLHRIDGPAVECANGNKYWYLLSALHRIGGPAIEFANGYYPAEYYLWGQKYSAEDYTTVLAELGL